MKIGVDILEVERLHDVSENFIERVYTEKEIEYINNFENRSERLAGFFCAKEAFLKALCINIKEISFKEVEILHEESGKPYINLYGKAKTAFKSLKEKNIELSISHSKTVAMAQVIIF